MSPLNPKNLDFHFILEKEVKQIKYGQMTFNVVLKDGKVLVDTLTITRSRRKKYHIK